MAISKIAALFLFKYAGTLEELREEWKNRIGTVPYIRKDIFIDNDQTYSTKYTTGTDIYKPITLHRDFYKAMITNAKNTLPATRKKEELLSTYKKYNIKNFHGIYNKGQLLRNETLNNEEKEAFNRIVGLHEMDEMDAMSKSIKDKAYFKMFKYHTLPEVILKEHNRITTLPIDAKVKIAPIIRLAREREELDSYFGKIIPDYEHGLSDPVDEQTIHKANLFFKKQTRREYE